MDLRRAVNSIAARIALTIAAALLSVGALTLSFVTSWGDLRPALFNTLWLANFAETTRMTLEPLAPRDRPAAADAAEHPLIEVEWRAAPPPFAAQTPVLFAPLAVALDARLGPGRTKIRSAIREGGLPRIVGTPAQMAPTPPGAGHLTPGVFELTIRLDDGSHVRLHASPRRQAAAAGLKVPLFFGAALALALGAAILAARVLAAPIKRFSAAAHRLELDSDPEPLREAGPAELRDAAAAFNAMQRRIARFVQDRTLMLVAISHDLRTPLTRHRLRVEQVADGPLREKMIADVAEMDAMLRASLAFARDQTEAEPVAKIDIAALLATIADEFEDQGARVAYQGPARRVIHGRPLALKRLFENLVDNGVRYGGRATLRLAEDARRLVISIEDDGPGVAAADAERVFDPFVRLDAARNADAAGAGLGLTIARAIARRHGGDVELRAGSGGGLRVEVSLPNPD